MLDTESCGLFQNLQLHIEDLVGRLRVNLARDPGDPAIPALVASLSRKSELFANIWAKHPAREGPLGLVQLRHPKLGPLEFRDTVLKSVEDETQALVVFHYEPGSDTERAMRSIAGP